MESLLDSAARNGPAARPSVHTLGLRLESAARFPQRPQDPFQHQQHDHLRKGFSPASPLPATVLGERPAKTWGPMGPEAATPPGYPHEMVRGHLVPAVKMVRNHFPALQIHALLPYTRFRAANAMRSVCNGTYQFREEHLERNLFPEELTLTDGTVIKRPQKYAPSSIPGVVKQGQ